MPEMNNVEMALYLRRMRLTDNYVDLTDLAHEIIAAFATDEATPRLVGMIKAKQGLLAQRN